MREILFRGKRKDNGKWVYGTLNNVLVEVPRIQYAVIEHGMLFLADFDAIPETVGQYTGLKDLHGTRIFEGDVVKYKIIMLNPLGKMEHKETKSVVKYNAPCFSPFETDLYEDYVMPEEAEVIGNIYDNPELLEGKQ